MLDILNTINENETLSFNEIIKNNFLNMELKELNFNVCFRPMGFMDVNNNIQYNAISQNAIRAVVRYNELNGVNKNGCAIQYCYLGSVGKSYGLVDNNQIFHAIKTGLVESIPVEFLKDVELIEKSSKNGAFSRFELIFKALKTPLLQYGKLEQTNLFFRVAVENTFDGSGKIKVYAGFFDQVCSNGLTIGTYVQDTQKHSGNFKANQIVQFIVNSVNEQKENLTKIEYWTKYKLSLESAGIFFKNNFPKRTAENLLNQYEAESLERGDSVWSLVSSLTHWSSHDSENFPVKQQQNTVGDTVQQTLSRREKIVNDLLNGKEFKELMPA